LWANGLGMRLPQRDLEDVAGKIGSGLVALGHDEDAVQHQTPDDVIVCMRRIDRPRLDHLGFDLDVAASRKLGLERTVIHRTLSLKNRFKNIRAAYHDPVGAGRNLQAKQDWLFTFLGRVGVGMGTWYPYLTGGLAVTHEKYSANFLNTFYPTNNTFTFDGTTAGWALGAGAEFRVSDHWLLRGEYL
jgi:opacity protein-like surface antigen